MRTTKKGRLLANTIGPAAGCSAELNHACSRICRAAATYQRLQEMRCNVPLDDAGAARLERREAGLERAITEACAQIGHGITPKFGGDPRGATVKLVMPPEWERLHDDGGREGVCVL